MRRLLLPGLIIAAALAVVWGSLFFWRNLRGAGPAWLSPPQDIAKLLDKDKGASGGQNLTGFPLKLPPGFSISIFARGLTTPRVLALDPEGTLLVSLLFDGRVVALPDRRHRGVADEVVTVRQDLRRPHGLAFLGGKLYIAETPEVAVYDYDPKTFQATNKRKIISLPPGGRHFTRTLLFLPGSDTSSGREGADVQGVEPGRKNVEQPPPAVAEQARAPAPHSFTFPKLLYPPRRKSRA